MNGLFYLKIVLFKISVYRNGEKCQIIVVKEICIFGLEHFLIKQQKEVARYITYLRTSNHKLPIQTGRNLDINRSDRIGQHCEDNLIGDEHQYICECKSQKICSLRNKYLPDYYRKRPYMFKFCQLLNRISNNRVLCVKLSNFLRALLKLLSKHCEGIHLLQLHTCFCYHLLIVAVLQTCLYKS